MQFVGMSTLLRLALVGCGAFIAALVAAEEVIQSVSSHKQGVYQVDIEIVLDAPFEHVHYVITDYVHMYRLNPAIVESEIVPAPDEAGIRVKTLINDCIFLYCWEILRVEDVQETAKGSIHAVVVPELSNLRSGLSQFKIEPLGSKTRIEFSARLEPGFFVPPLVGSYLVRTKLYREAVATFRNAERVARIRSANQNVRTSKPSGSP